MGIKKQAGSGQRLSVMEEDCIGNHGQLRTVALEMKKKKKNRKFQRSGKTEYLKG